MSYPIRDGFTISVSGVESQEITGIKTTIDSEPSNTDLPTEKAVKDYVDGTYGVMTSAGDLIVGGTSGTPERLGIGTQGQVLKVGSNGIEWGNDSAGMTNPMTSAGDIIVGGSSGSPSRLAIGTSGQVLTSNGTTANWADIPIQPDDHKVLTTSADETAGFLADKLTEGQGITIETSGSTDQTLSIGIDTTSATSGDVLTFSSNAPTWKPIPGLYLGAFPSNARPSYATTGQTILDTDLGYVIYRYGDAWINSTGAIIEGNVQPSNDPVDWIDNPMTSAGDLIVGGALGQPQRLGLGTTGQVLTVGSSGPTWANEGSGGSGLVKVTSADTSASFLADKLTAGSNITLTTNTDGDGVQTLEIASTGGGSGGGSAWSEVLPPTNITYGSGTYYGVARLFEPGADVVRSLCLWSAGFTRDKDTRGSIAIYRASVASGSTVLLSSGTLTMTRIAYRKFKVKANGFCHWYDFAADVDVSDKSYIYAYAISFEEYYGPMSSFKLMCSSYSVAASSQKAFVEKMLGNDTLIGNTFQFSVDDSRYQYSIASGVSSVPRQTETEV